jgi:hypothetical protein
MSRHTPLSGKLTRSFGLYGTSYAVVVLDGEAKTVALRLEPGGRKLKRGESLPETVLKVEDLVAAADRGESVEAETASVAADIMKRLEAKLAVAKLSDGTALSGKDAYRIKVLLLQALRENEQIPKSGGRCD